MNDILTEIREQQRASWNKFSFGWKKWDLTMMKFLKPMGDAIISKLSPKNGDYILDIAAGTGEPGLTIAKMVKDGKVVITDLSDEMLKVTNENAEKQGIKNIETLACDVCELPFADNSFDAISCRFGFMFFPDMLLAATEMYRVLKPGGKIAATVWNVPEKNFWVTVLGGTISRNMQLPVPLFDAPGMFRCAPTGLMLAILQQAGFVDTEENEVEGLLKCGSADTYWNMMTEVAAPFVAALSKADDDIHAAIKKEVFDLLQQRYPTSVDIAASALVISGKK